MNQCRGEGRKLTVDMIKNVKGVGVAVLKYAMEDRQAATVAKICESVH